MAVLGTVTLELVLRPAGSPHLPGANETVLGTIELDVPAVVSLEPTQQPL